MKIGNFIFCIFFTACFAVSASALVWLGKFGYDIQQKRNDEMHLAETIREIQRVELRIDYLWYITQTGLNNIPRGQLTQVAAKKVLCQSSFDSIPWKIFQCRINDLPKQINVEQIGEKITTQCTDGEIFALRHGSDGTIEGIVFPQDQMIACVENTVRQPVTPMRSVVLKVIPSSGDSTAFGTVRRLAGMRIVGERVPSTGDSHAAQTAFTIAFLSAGIALLGLCVLLVILFIQGERRRMFAAAVSHELRTPIAEFQAKTQRAIFHEKNENISAKLHELHDDAQEMAILVENILCFARMENGGKAFPWERSTVSAVMEKASFKICEHLMKAGIDALFEIDPQAREREILTSTAALGQILFNLADNAKKHAHAGDETLVRFHVRAFGNKLEIDVEDNGSGIPEQDQATVFKPFFSRGSGQHGGLGLGLCISERIAAMLHGRLELIKSDSAGTVFRLTLELCKKRN